MIAVIFEGETKPGQTATYFDTAAALKPLVEQIDGFISIERFESVSTPGRYLSLSFWQNEAAIAAWRAAPDHADAQALGRRDVFADYRIRVATVVRDYGLQDRTGGCRGGCSGANP